VTLEEWIAKYNEKSPEPFQENTGYALYFEMEKGFCEIGFTKDMVIINQMCGDGRWWKDAVDRIAETAGLHHIGTWATRSVKGYIRRFGYRIYQTENLIDGTKRYFFIDDNNHKGIASPAYRNADGTLTYYLTWEI